MNTHRTFTLITTGFLSVSLFFSPVAFAEMDGEKMMGGEKMMKEGMMREGK